MSVPLGRPELYPRGSELYYLAWSYHGTWGQREAAAAKLVRLENKTHYKLTSQIAQHARPLIGASDDILYNALLLSLFDMRPAEHYKAVQSLMRHQHPAYQNAGGWIKTSDVYFEDHVVDFYFDWGAEAALLLAKHGYLDRDVFDILVQLARSFYPNDREDAAKTFRLLQSCPRFNPGRQPATINEQPPDSRAELRAITEWYETHGSRIEWNSDSRTYTLRSSG